MNIFEQASRKKIRFASTRGDLMVEQLWDMPLQSKSGFDLDSLAKALNAEVKASQEESFVAPASATNTAAVLAFDIVKHVIAVKLEENEKARGASERKAKRDKLLELLEKKQDAALGELSVEDLRKQIEALEA